MMNMRVLQSSTVSSAMLLLSSDFCQNTKSLHNSATEYVHIKSGTMDVEVTWGVYAAKGKRKYMEDRHCIVPSVRFEDRCAHCFGVFDGHGGTAASEFCSKRIPEILKQSKIDIVQSSQDALIDTIARVESEFKQQSFALSRQYSSGTTAVVALVKPDGEIVVANLGDSRALLIENGIARSLSVDHKPSRPDEQRRIELAGGKVSKVDSVYRVCAKDGSGGLAVSRSIGDYYLKDVSSQDLVSAEPEFKARTIAFGHSSSRGSTVLLLATDGLWDTMSNENVCNIITDVAQCHSDRSCVGEPCSLPEAISTKLVVKALERGGEDNITALVVIFRPIDTNSDDSIDGMLAQLNQKMQALELSVQYSQDINEVTEEPEQNREQMTRRRRRR